MTLTASTDDAMAEEIKRCVGPFNCPSEAIRAAKADPMCRELGGMFITKHRLSGAYEYHYPITQTLYGEDLVLALRWDEEKDSFVHHNDPDSMMRAHGIPCGGM